MAASDGGHIIDIVIQTNDQTAGGLNRAQERFLRFDRSVQRMQERIRNFTASAHDVTINLIDRVTPAGSAINRFLHRMTDRAHEIALRMNDRATDRLRGIGTQLSQLTSRAYTVTVNLRDRATNGIKDIANNTLSSITGFSGGMIAGAGIGYGIMDTVNTYKNFEQQMSAVQSISGASAKELEMLTEKAKEMGASTSFSATEAGKAFEYMGMAGWKTEQMMSGIAGVMNLAAASGEELGMVSDIVTDAMTGLHMGAEESQRFADVLAATVTGSNTTVSKLGYTFKYVAPLAGSLGYQIEDLAAVIGMMANAGIKSESAGTALRTMLTNVVNPTGQVDALMTQLGVSFKNTDGSARPFRDSIRDLRERFKGMTQAEKLANAEILANKEGMTALIAVMDQSDADFEKMFSIVDNAEGAADRMAKIRLDNLAGDLEELGGAWETFQLNLMSGKGAGFLRDIVKAAGEDIDKLNEYMKDGFDFEDIGRLAMDVITQLKNKFLELDGVGSILAGGALVGAIGMITSKAMKLADVLRDAAGIGRGAGGRTGDGRSGGGTPSGAGGSVGAMTVHANVVNVHGGGDSMPTPDGSPASNGRTAGEGGEGGARGGSGTAAESRMARGLKWFGRIAAALGVAEAAYDTYAVSQDNDRLVEEAEWRNYVADEDYEKKKANFQAATTAYENGELSEESFDAIRNEFNAAAKEQSDSRDYQEWTGQLTRDRMNDAIGGNAGMVAGMLAGGKAGAVLGSGIGTFFGGPIGTAIGGGLGGILGGATGAFAGSELGKNLGIDWQAIPDKAKEAVDGAVKAIEEGFTNAKAHASEIWNGFFGDEAITAAKESLSAISLESIWDGFFGATSFQGTGEYFAGIGESISTCLEEAKTTAAEKWAEISSYPGQAAAVVMEVFGALPSWFSDTVWSPISDHASSVGDTITDAFNTALSVVKGAWSSLAGWFEENVIAPVKTKFDSIRSLAAGLPGIGGFVGSGAEAKAFGGFVTSPRTILAGEDGGEVIIPLSPNKRSRAMGLFERTRQILESGTFGGISGTDMLDSYESDDPLELAQIPGIVMDENDAGQPIAVPVASGNGNGGMTATVEMGGININVTVSGGENAQNTADDVLRVIRENMERIADEAGGKMAETIGNIWNNQPMFGA